jgi:hypothetical protein
MEYVAFSTASGDIGLRQRGSLEDSAPHRRLRDAIVGALPNILRNDSGILPADEFETVTREFRDTSLSELAKQVAYTRGAQHEYSADFSAALAEALNTIIVPEFKNRMNSLRPFFVEKPVPNFRAVNVLSMEFADLEEVIDEQAESICESPRLVSTPGARLRNYESRFFVSRRIFQTLGGELALGAVNHAISVFRLETSLIAEQLVNATVARTDDSVPLFDESNSTIAPLTLTTLDSAVDYLESFAGLMVGNDQLAAQDILRRVNMTVPVFLNKSLPYGSWYAFGNQFEKPSLMRLVESGSSREPYLAGVRQKDGRYGYAGYHSVGYALLGGAGIYRGGI